MYLEVRQAQLSDAERLTPVLEQSRLHKISQGDLGWGLDPFTQTEVAESIDQGATYIGEIDGRVAGSLILIHSDEVIWGQELGNDEKATYIHRLAVGDAFRGQRIGRRMIAWATDETRSRGLPYLRLDCNSENQKLCSYYRDQGFTKVGLTRIDGQIAALWERPV